MDAATLDILHELISSVGAAPLAVGETAAPVLALPSGVELRSLERFAEVPAFRRGSFSTSSLSAFLAYARHWCGLNSAVFIQPETMEAVAIIDHGSADVDAEPDWGRHTARIKLATTPPYAGLLATQNISYTQQQFIDWAEDWGPDTVIFHRGDDELEWTASIHALRRLQLRQNRATTHETTHLRTARSAMENIEADSLDTKSLPDGFTFVCESYLDLPVIAIRAALRIGEKDDKPVIAIRILGLARFQLAIAEAFADRLNAGLEGIGCPIYLGSYLNQQEK